MNGTRWAQVLLVVVAGLGFWLAASVEKPWTLEPGADGWQDDVVRGVFYGSLANALLALVLAALANRWARPLPDPAGVVLPPRVGSPIWFWWLTGGAVVLSGALRWNLAHRSLWWDEVWQLKNAAHGYYKSDAGGDGTLEFSPTSWGKCAWYYQKPTNHAPAALGAKASLAFWHKVTGAPREAFNDFAVRLPTFLASLAAVVAIAVLVRGWIHPAAGVTAGILLALHPWHVRYGIDTRAYSYLVLVVILGALALTKLARSSRWRPWLAFGFTQFLLVWSLPNAVWYAAGFFVAALAVVVVGWKPGNGRAAALGRLAAVNVLAAMLFIQVAGPNIFQAARWVGTLYEPHYLSADLLLDTGVQLATGTPLRATGGNDDGAGLASVASHPRTGWITAFVLLASVVGLVLVACRNRTALVIISALLASAAAYLAATAALEHHFYPRYVIYLLPVVVATAAIGLSFWRGRVGFFVTAAGLVLLAWGFLPQLRVLATRPYAPLRDVGEFLARESSASPVTALGYQLGGKVLTAYFPPLVPLVGPAEQSREDLLAEMALARESGRRLFVVFGYPEFNRTIAPGGFSLLDDPALFREVAAFEGIEPDFTFRVLEATGALPSATGPERPPPTR